MATMYRPSGDQRGEKRPFESGNVEIWFVFTSRIRTALAGSAGPLPKAILLPLED